MNPPTERPPGCQEIHGYVVQVGFGGWLDSEGEPTVCWHERGIWPTLEEADAAREKFCKTLPE